MVGATDGGTNGWRHRWMDGLADRWWERRMQVSTDGGTDGWIDGMTDVCLSFLFVRCVNATKQQSNERSISKSQRANLYLNDATNEHMIFHDQIDVGLLWLLLSLSQLLFFISGNVDYIETSLVTRHRNTSVSFWQRICMCVCLCLSSCACAYVFVLFLLSLVITAPLPHQFRWLLHALRMCLPVCACVFVLFSLSLDISVWLSGKFRLNFFVCV